MKGQAWHDWVNHKGAGDALACDSCKEIVLEMHGDSLLTCIKNVFNPKIKGESFGARSTPARAYMDRLFKGAHTAAQWQERVEMWIILSSYHEDCIAAVLNTNPLTKAQLASAVSQYMELHPEAGKRQSMQGNKFQGSKPYKNYYTSPSQDRSRGWQQNFKPQQQWQPHPQQPHPQQQWQSRPQQQQQQQPHICHICKQIGHKSYCCPQKGRGYSNQLYTKKATYRLKNSETSKKVPNIVNGCVNGIQTSFLLDNGADITIINKNLVHGEQLTGELVTFNGFGGEEFTFPTAVLEIEVGDLCIPLLAAVVDIHDKYDGGLLGNDIDYDTFMSLLKQAELHRLHADKKVYVKLTRAQRKKQECAEQELERQESEECALAIPIECINNTESVDEISEVAEQNGLEEESGSVVLAEDSLDLGLDSLDTSREVEWLGGMDVDALVEELSAQPTSVNESCAIPLEHIENDCELLTSLDPPGELVHVNNCKEFKKDTVMVYRLVVSAEEHNVDTDKSRL